MKMAVFLSIIFGKQSARRRVLKFLPAALALGLSIKFFRDSRIPQPELGDVASGLFAVFFLVASIIAFFTALIIETYNGSPNTSLNSKAAHNSDSGTMAASNAKPAAERDEPISTKTP